MVPSPSMSRWMQVPLVLLCLLVLTAQADKNTWIDNLSSKAIAVNIFYGAGVQSNPIRGGNDVQDQIVQPGASFDISYPSVDTSCQVGQLFQDNKGNGPEFLPSGLRPPNCGPWILIKIGGGHVGRATESGSVFIAPDQSLVVVDSKTDMGGWDVYKSAYGNIAQIDGTDHISFYDCPLTDPSSCPDGQ